MSFIVIIPARYDSTRLPGKPLADIAGKPLIEHVVDRANESDAERVIVATDDERIKNALNEVDCEVCMTRYDHQSGSDRLTEVVENLLIEDQSIVVNVQGDEPLIPPSLINRVAMLLKNSENASMATAAHPIVDISEINNPNVVKVVFNQQSQAMYFSRSAIPFNRENDAIEAWKHIGIYAYRAEFLKRYHSLSLSKIEQAENLEQLRVLDNGETILIEKVDYDAGVGVDTPEDLEKVRSLLRSD